MIWCIWYPSGGFGHFLNAVISLHGRNFERPKKTQSFKVNPNGNSHGMDVAVPRYFFNPDSYNYNFDPNKNYSVLVDNGINDEGEKFLTVFPWANIIKVCYSDYSWSVVGLTMINKAIESTIEKELNTSSWHTDQNWAAREKYFLYLRDHTLRHSWKPDTRFHTIMIEDLLSYSHLKSKLDSFGLPIDDFQSSYNQWYQANLRYFEPMLRSQQIIDSIKHNTNHNMSDITDLWSQAVIYYYIWLTFGIEVPHNDYADFFKDSNQIKSWLNTAGISV